MTRPLWGDITGYVQRSLPDVLRDVPRRLELSEHVKGSLRSLHARDIESKTTSKPQRKARFVLLTASA